MSIFSSIGNFFKNDVAPAFGVPTSGGAGSVIKGIMESGIGAGLAGIANAQAHNRGAKLSAMMSGDQMQMAEQAQRDQQLPQALRQFGIANWIANGGDPNAGKPITFANGHKINIGYTPISDQYKQEAANAASQFKNTIDTPPTYSNYASVMNPGKLESIFGVLGPIMAASSNAQNQKTQQAGYNALLQKLLGQQQTTTPPTTTVGQVYDDSGR